MQFPTLALALLVSSATASVGDAADAASRRRLGACEPVSEIDLGRYVGRWYNVYYDKFTTLFSSPDCATAYYAAADARAAAPTLTVNNSGVARRGGGGSTYITGSVSQADPAAPAELVLRLDGVPRDASYRVCALGPPTHGAGYYEYAVVTDDRGLSLYVLARDVDTFFAEHDAEVAALLADLGYTGLVWGAAKNKQDGCPADIYAPRWDPSVAPKASTRRFGLF